MIDLFVYLFRTCLKQKKALCVWSKMQILPVYFVWQILRKIFSLSAVCNYDLHWQKDITDNFVKIELSPIALDIMQ